MELAMFTLHLSAAEALSKVVVYSEGSQGSVPVFGEGQTQHLQDTASGL